MFSNIFRDISKGRENIPIPCVNGIDDDGIPRDYLYVTDNIETKCLNVNRVIGSLQVCSICIFVCLFVCCFTSQVNSYGHCGTVSSPNHIFSWAGLNKRLTSNSCTYFRL